MKIKIALLVLVLGIGIFLLRDQVMETEPKTDPKTREVPENIDSTGELTESIPMINFPLLGEARPTDLIEMALSFPESLMKLDGRKVSLVGFMAPFDSLDDMSRCMIVPSYVGCTFCSPPNKRQVVFITQGKEGSPDQTYSFIEEPSHVTGIFRISLPIEIMKERPRVLFTRLRTLKLGSIPVKLRSGHPVTLLQVVTIQAKK